LQSYHPPLARIIAAEGRLDQAGEAVKRGMRARAVLLLSGRVRFLLHSFRCTSSHVASALKGAHGRYGDEAEHGQCQNAAEHGGVVTECVRQNGEKIHRSRT
jgi:hypothetical protein